MYLADEQMWCVDSRRDVTWQEIPLPVGPHPIPRWAKGMHINWMEEWDCPPHIMIKADCDLRTWEGKRFTKEGSKYIAVSGDGRAEIYYQDGAWRPAILKRFRRASDGALSRYANLNSKGKVEPGEWVDIERLCTPQQEGFGGAHIDITMTDGTEITLRGPWHGPTPPGFIEVSYCDMVGMARYRTRMQRPWHESTAIGGLWLKEEAFIPIFARHCPEGRLYRITGHGASHIEPFKGTWSEPHWITREVERCKLRQQQ